MGKSAEVAWTFAGFFNFRMKPSKVLTGEVIPPHKGPRCPFYGFRSFGNVFIRNDDGMDSCALSYNCPCYMELSGAKPDWNMCPAYNRLEYIPTIKNIIKSTRTVPIEFRPKDEPDWLGISFDLWFQHVMGHPFP